MQVAGRVVSQGGRVTVRVNGAEVALPGDGTQGTFNTVRYFASGAESLAVSVTATDALGRASTANATVYRDLTGPQITLDEALAPMPGENLRTESPYVLSGIVRDARLAGLLIDDAPATLEPTADPAEYRFTQTLPILASGRLVTLTASDTAGNVTQQAYHLSIDPAALIEPIVPLDGARFATEGAPVNVQVAARLSGEAAGASASAIVTAGGASTTFPLTLDGTLVSGDVLLPVQAGVEEQPATIRYEVRHPSVGLVAATQVGVTVNNVGAQPVAVARITPDSTEGFLKTNEIITVFFNKAVDPTRLTLEVRETLHGKTYANQDPPGADFAHMKGHQLVDVHRDREQVAGALDPVPGNQAFIFTPARFFGFGGTVYVDVAYDGQSIGGAQWTVEPLPTQVSGIVVDQFGKEVQGVTVALGNLLATTNSDGAFAFGFEGESRLVMRGGDHVLELNPGQKDARFGYRRHDLLLDQGRYRSLGKLVLPLLNERAGFSVLRAGVRNELAQGNVVVDLASGSVQGPAGMENLAINVQLIGAAQLGYPFGTVAPVGGVYLLEPAWLSISGSVQLEVALPNARSGFEDGDPVFFLGLDSLRGRLIPVAIGEVQGGRAVQRGNWNGEWIDVIGIAPVPGASIPAINDYLESGGSWSTVLGGMSQ